MSAQKLNRKIVLIFERDVIREHKTIFTGVAEILLVARMNGYANAAGCFC